MNFHAKIRRRTALKSLAVAGAAAVLPRGLRAAGANAPTVRTITYYLQTLKRDDHGYGWGDVEISHLTPTFGVIGSYHVLKQTPPDKEALIQYVRTHHPRELKKLEQERRIFDWQQV